MEFLPLGEFLYLFFTFFPASSFPSPSQIAPSHPHTLELFLPPPASLVNGSENKSFSYLYYIKLCNLSLLHRLIVLILGLFHFASLLRCFFDPFNISCLSFSLSTFLLSCRSPFLLYFYIVVPFFLVGNRTTALWLVTS